MREDTKRQLDEQLKKKRSFLFYGVIALILVANALILLYTSVSTSIIQGAVSHVEIEASSSSLDKKAFVVLDSGEEVLINVPAEFDARADDRIVVKEKVFILGNRSYQFVRIEE